MHHVTEFTKVDVEHKHLLSVGSQPVVSALVMQGPAQSGKPWRRRRGRIVEADTAVETATRVRASEKRMVNE